MTWWRNHKRETYSTTIWYLLHASTDFTITLYYYDAKQYATNQNYWDDRSFSGYSNLIPIRKLYNISQALGTYISVHTHDEWIIIEKVPVRAGYTGWYKFTQYYE